jgi:transposase InsO family protein
LKCQDRAEYAVDNQHGGQEHREGDHTGEGVGRYGYRKIAALLRDAGWLVNDKRVERIWRREGLKVPKKQPKRGRLWLTDGSCIRLRPEYRNHVWSYDFVEDRTHDGRKYRMLNVLDEFTHESLAIRVARKLKAIDVIDVLSDLFILRGVPGHIRSDNGPEFVAKAVREWIAAVGAKTAYITPGSPWGERLHRELKRPPARRAAGRGDLLFAEGGADRDRELAAPLQCYPPTCVAWISAAGPRSLCTSARRVAVCALGIRSDGHAHAGVENWAKLTFESGHSRGADQAEYRVPCNQARKLGCESTGPDVSAWAPSPRALLRCSVTRQGHCALTHRSTPTDAPGPAWRSCRVYIPIPRRKFSNATTSNVIQFLKRTGDNDPHFVAWRYLRGEIIIMVEGFDADDVDGEPC